MADLSTVLGSIMTAIVNARGMADKETAALAEYYTSNPLLEALPVPRIRIPELVIDIPVLVEGTIQATAGSYADTSIIASEAARQLEITVAERKIDLDTTKIYESFYKDVSIKLDEYKNLQSPSSPIMKEAIVRIVQDTFSDVLTNNGINLQLLDMQYITSDLREKISSVCIANMDIAPSILTNINTADVKEFSTGTSIVQLKVTLKEEGLEWSKRESNSGGVECTLRVE